MGRLPVPADARWQRTSLAAALPTIITRRVSPAIGKNAHLPRGEGEAVRVTRDSLTVLFDEAGYKVLDLGIVLEQEMLKKGRSR